MKNIIKGAIVEELNATIKGSNLEKLGPTEIKKFLKEMNEIGESYTGRDLTRIDKSKEDFNEDAMLDLLASNMFYNNVKYDSKILALMFKYLLFSSNERIINRTIEQYFTRYKHFFKNVNFDTIRSEQQPQDVLEKLKELDEIEKGTKKQKENVLGPKVPMQNIMVFGSYTTTPKLTAKLRKTIEYDYLANSCSKLDCFENLIKLYIKEDISNKNFAYIYKLFTKKIALEKDELVRQEMMLILQAIDMRRISFVEGSDKFTAVNIDYSAYNRILNKCDESDIDLNITEILAIEKALTINNKEHQEVRNEIVNLYRLYRRTNYSFKTEEFLDFINKERQVNLRKLYHGLGEEKLTKEMFDNLCDTRYVYTWKKFPYYTSRLGIHKSTKKVLNIEELILNDYLKKEAEVAKRRKEIEKKYKFLRSKLTNDVMLSYILLKYVPVADKNEVEILIKNWERNGSIEEITKDDARKKRNTLDSLINDFKEECKDIPYKKYEAIKDKYLAIYDALNIYVQKGKKTQYIRELDQIKKEVVVREIKKSLKEIKDKLLAKKNPIKLLENKGITLDVLASILPLVKEAGIKDIIETICNMSKKEIEDIEKEKKLEEKARKEQEKIDGAVSLLSEFIFSNCTSKEEFLILYQKDVKDFDKAISILKKAEHPLLIEVENKVKKAKEETLIEVLPIVTELVDDILNGVTLPNGDIVQFEHIDFVTRTSLSVDEFLNIVKNNMNLSAEDERKLILAVKSKVKKIPMINDYLLQETYVINDLEIPYEVKKAILDYLQSKGIEKDLRAYRQAIQRYLKKALDISEFLGDFDDSYIFDEKIKKN